MIALHLSIHHLKLMTVREKAVAHLLKSPAIEYIRSLEAMPQANPDYVNANRVDVGNIVQGFLAGGGFHWDEEIFEKEWPGILDEALAQVASKKS